MLKELSLTHELLRIGQGSNSFMYDGFNGLEMYQFTVDVSNWSGIIFV